MKARLVIAAVLVALAANASTADASRKAEYGVQDDAWLQVGAPKSGPLEERLATLDRRGVDVVRYTLRWDHIALRRPAQAVNPVAPAYDWSSSDALLTGLHSHGIDVVLTLWGSPAWANGRHKPNWAPRSASALASFAIAAALRYPWIHKWEIWNEPNQRGGLDPNSPRLYVQRLLNPTVEALHALNRRNVVAGGATSCAACAAPAHGSTSTRTIRIRAGSAAAGRRRRFRRCPAPAG